MADISSITLPDGNTYNFKDTVARASAAVPGNILIMGFETITCTGATTAQWGVGNATGYASVVDGATNYVAIPMGSAFAVPTDTQTITVGSTQVTVVQRLREIYETHTLSCKMLVIAYQVL